MHPNLFLLGPSRTGTTSLYYLLRQHPEIFCPTIKEPKFFTGALMINPRNGPGDKLYMDTITKHKSAYIDLYKDSNSFYNLDASSDYFYFIEDIYKKILDECENPFVIISLRNPIERAFSSYQNLRRDNRINISFQEYISSQNIWKKKGYDPMWLGMTGSLYFQKIKLIKENFKNVLVLFYEDFKVDPISNLSQIEEFLNIQKLKYKDLNIAYSTSINTNFITKYFFNNSSFVVRKLKSILKFIFGRRALEIFLSYLSKKNKDIIKVDSYWDKLFREDKKRLENLLNSKVPW